MIRTLQGDAAPEDPDNPPYQMQAQTAAGSLRSNACLPPHKGLEDAAGLFRGDSRAVVFDDDEQSTMKDFLLGDQADLCRISLASINGQPVADSVQQ